MSCVTCDCLNLIVQIRSELDNKNAKIDMLDLADPKQGIETVNFLKSALGPFKGNVSIRHEALVHQIKLDYSDWTINRCLNCDSYVYAHGEKAFSGMLLVNAKQARDEAQLRAMMNCDKYSMPFKVVVKPIAVLPRALQKSINDDVRVKSMFDQLESFIETDSKQTEAEIRRLQMEMNNRRQEAEIDFQRIAAVIELFNGTIASTMSTDSCELTPPVTPESVNDKMMSMDNQIPHDKLNGKRDGSSKHSSAINPKLITKTIDFEEDVFAFDGMQEEATNEADRYHKYSDTEEGSDGENTVEMRAYNRGRSGSVNIARSAPISMPRFPYQRVDIDTDDEKSTVEQEMDIASSMKILARSVRADNIFGELPAPPVLRHNAEY